MTIRLAQKSPVLVAVLVLSACVPAGGVKTGGSPNLIHGSAGGSTSINANKKLEHCASPLGTLAVSDGRFTGSSSVTTVEPLIRLAAQQSNCFVMTSIGNIATDAQLDRIIDKQRNSGDIRSGSHQEKGQQVAADYFLEPQVIVQNEVTENTGANVGAALLGFGLSAAGLGGLSGAATTLAGGGNTETRISDVTLTLTDIRSRVQVSISQGSATTTNVSASGSAAFGGWGGLMGGAVSGGISSYTRTPENIAIAAAFFDSYNGMVLGLRNYTAQDVKGGMGRGGQLKVN